MTILMGVVNVTGAIGEITAEKVQCRNVTLFKEISKLLSYNFLILGYRADCIRDFLEIPEKVVYIHKSTYDIIYVHTLMYHIQQVGNHCRVYHIQHCVFCSAQLT